MAEKMRLSSAPMTGAQFRQWRLWLRWSQTTAAEMLGYSKSGVQKLEAGRDKPVPRVVELACYALSHNVRRYNGPEDVVER